MNAAGPGDPMEMKTASTLRSLEGHDEFLARHIGAPPPAQDAMLQEIGFASRADRKSVV